MFEWLKRKLGYSEQRDQHQEASPLPLACDHSAVSFPLAESDIPMTMQCYLCNRIRVEYDTGIPLAKGLLHTQIKHFWVEPDPGLEQAIETSPREFGNLRIEKWLRNKNLI